MPFSRPRRDWFDLAPEPRLVHVETSRARSRAVLRRNQPRMLGAIANAPVAAKRGLPAVRTLIPRAASGAENAACAVACRAVNRVALVSNGAVLKRVAIRGGRYAAASCGGVAVADVVAERHMFFLSLRNR